MDLERLSVMTQNKSSNWSVTPSKNGWVLTWEISPTERHIVVVASMNVPEGIAIDTALEYMDRITEGSYPRDMDDQSIMDWCLRNSLRSSRGVKATA